MAVLRRKTEEIHPAIAGRRRGRDVTAVGAYIFAGLFTIGVSEHMNPLAHLEDGNFGVATARRNFPKLEIHTDPATWPTGRYRGVDFVYANPPCAPWSQANGGKYDSWRSDPRVSCVFRAFGLLGKLRPRVWCFESVRGAYTKGREMVDSMAADARAMGYQVTHLLTDGVECGLPQNRRRYFMVCHNVDIDWVPTGAKPRTVSDAIRNLRIAGDVVDKVPARFDGIIDRVKQGQRLRDVFDKENGITMDDDGVASRDGPVKGRPGFLIFKLSWDRPSATITGSATKIHPDKPRFITMGESKALCGVPQSFKFEGTVSQQYAQIAKAVMPPVAEYLAGRVADAVRKDRPADPGVVSEVTIRSATIETKEIPDAGQDQA